MELKVGETARGFTKIKFIDRYGEECSLQKSSLGSEDAIWLGLEDAKPQIMASDAIYMGLPTGGETTGWVPYEVPKQVLLSTRMHLTQEQVKVLLPVLQKFVETGELT